jgi:hypothetical protein
MSTKLELARDEAAKHRATFLRLHREACVSFGAYCEAMEKVQALTSLLHQPMLGGNPEAENKLAQLLIRESPIVTAKRSGLEVTRGWGWNKSTDVVPLVRAANTAEVA